MMSCDVSPVAMFSYMMASLSSMDNIIQESRSSSSNISGSMNCKKREAKAIAIAVAIPVAV